MAPSDQNRDITLNPASYLYLVNEGKGGIMTVHRGPTVVNQTGQDQPVKFNPVTGQYGACSLEQAVQTFPRAKEGDYIVLENPSINDGFPMSPQQQAAELKKGRKVIIAGPWSEALWPGQSAQAIEGHRLRSNQYVLAIIYNAEEAKKNWASTVAVPITETEETDETSETLKKKETHRKGLPTPDSFAVGTRIIIKGSDVSFYIPCTGVEVLKDENSKYVREAVTLEQLEYCCLVDESGKRDYPRGPQVVFPLPTQVFETDKKQRRKFKPIELNIMNGLHLKATTDFEDEDLESPVGLDGNRPIRKYKEGDELFITGNTVKTYYPREELLVMEFGQGNKKHLSTAIPKGHGRYVIDRSTGDAKLLRGPLMYLADPRTEIPVRRVLSQDDCSLWYPGNIEALTYNRELAEVAAASPSGRSGSAVSEGDYRKVRMRGMMPSAAGLESLSSSSYDEYEPEDTGEAGGAGSSRNISGNKPITMNSKFDGVPRIEVWPGYAVLIVGADGARRVEQGPQVILLQYDEKLGHMDLSTGKPKSTDKLMKTAYLCVQNNQVGDIVSFESSDHVKGTIKISLRVEFIGETPDEKLKWFSVDNYVKFLTDHVRSLVAGMGKRNTVASIKSDYVNLIRDAILGEKQEKGRPGLIFESNNMRVVEVEVLDIALTDKTISQLLDQAQLNVVQTNITIDNARKKAESDIALLTIEQGVIFEKAERQLQTLRKNNEVSRVSATVAAETEDLKRKLQLDAIEGQIELLVANLNVDLQNLASRFDKSKLEEQIHDFTSEKVLARSKAETDHQLSVDTNNWELKKLEIETTTKAAVDRFNSAKDGLYDVLIMLNRDETAAKLAEGCTIERYLSGDSVGSSIGNLLSAFPMLKGFMDKAELLQNGKGNRLTSSASVPANK